MATFLFDKIIFGPVISRRLGVSLGINLLPETSKLCNYDCIYCECGWNGAQRAGRMPSRDEVRQGLHSKLAEMSAGGAMPDAITFAGNGEPTVHPDFAGIIADTMELRNRTCPAAQIVVLTNATMLHKPEVVGALLAADRALLKIDSAIENTRELINMPQRKQSLAELERLLVPFAGRLILQTLFLRAVHKGQIIDNTTIAEVDALLAFYKRAKPAEVMVYCVDRDTPLDTVEKIMPHELDSIAQRIRQLGIAATVSY
jgi:wyosine [tRNA(Phe)-imidazoG37] synthetase (radical SAM superfamily)